MKYLLLLSAIFAAPRIGAAIEAKAVRERATANFERNVQPILRAHCFDCHGAHESPEGNLDLRLRRSSVKGGDSGPAIVPGDGESSLLLQRVRAGEMPPTEKKLSADEIAVLESWIAAGAPTMRTEPQTLGPGLPITEEERAFWAFQPPRRPSIPAFGSQDRVRTSIDALLLARMRERGLAFSPDAD